MASNLDGFSFTNIRPSPTNPHKPPKYIKPLQIYRSGSLSSSETDLPEVKRSHTDSHTRFKKLSSPHSDLTDVKRSYLDSQWTNVKTPYLESDTISRDPVVKPNFEDKREKSEKNNGVVNPNDVTFEYTSRSRNAIDQMQIGEQDNKKDKNDKKGWRYKLITGIIVIIAAILGTIFFIIYYTNSSSSTLADTTTDNKCSRTQGLIGFNDIFTINCAISLDKYQLTNLSILFKPKYESYQPVNKFLFSLTEGNIATSGWNITVFNNTKNSKARFVITREPAKCDSGGSYTFQFNSSDNTIVLNHTEDFEINSKISDVNIQVSYNNISDGSYYEISCSAQSACTPAPITLLGLFTNNGEYTPIFGVNFTCIINYNDDDGWTVKCTGTVPQNVYSSLTSIACQPMTGNKTKDKSVIVEIPACKDCIFECPKDDVNDSYWTDPVICNIFHRCHEGRQYTMPCPVTTYFNPKSCSCDFAENILDHCDAKNQRITIQEKIKKCS